ncbi:MAG: HlyD family efflux transporter periplasmic adaptor subunit [Deltaproteobacteria bacterium]|nr:HlyD family efflux transporter periplasmic adaptor subunit [Deltaproteobacteria bacterium]
MRWTTILIIALVVVVVAVVTVLALLPSPVPVDVARVSRGPLVVTIDEDGRTRATERHVVSAPLAGNLLRIEHHAGDRVRVNDVLARLMPTTSPLLDERSRAQAEARLRSATAARAQAEAAVERARLGLEIAQRETVRQRTLAARHSVAERAVEIASFEERSRRAELSAARSASRAAASEVDAVRAALGTVGSRATPSTVEVRSPIDGVVFRVIASSAGVVGPGSPLLEVGDPAQLEIVTDLLTSDAVSVRPGARVIVQGWGGDRVLRGSVRHIEPSAITRVSVLGVEEQRVDAIIDLLDPPAVRAGLGDGYRVQVRIVVWERTDVLRVPFGAPFPCDGSGHCVLLVEGERARQRRVRLGRRADGQVEVVSGLREGQSVVLHPGDRVTDGVEVVPR